MLLPKVKLSKNIWGNLILFGFMGQVAWSMENVYFNTFLFNYVGGTTRDIARMVALSAATAVITTFIMGTLSDKLNKRKGFICLGYILWGLTVAVFAFISRDNIAALFKLTNQAGIVTATVSVVIIMDCIMTFMGSTANDSAFNAWVTDVTVPANRGTAEGILSIMPILATLIVTIGFGAGVAAVGYPACFIGLGVVVSLCGVAGLFTIKESRSGIVKQSNYFKDLIYGFRPSVIKANSRLYLALSAICIFGVAVQMFFPYIFIYLQHFLGFDFNNLRITAAGAVTAVVILACVVAGAVGLGVLVDKYGKTRFIVPSVIIFVGGLFAALFVRKLSVFGLLALVIIAGYGLLMIILNAAVRDFTPEENVGLFQGVRMIFFVLIPMILGPFLGNTVIEAFASKHATGTYLNDFNEAVMVPVPEIFAAAAILGLLIFLPLAFIKEYKKQ
jgi:MFS family permease